MTTFHDLILRAGAELAIRDEQEEEISPYYFYRDNHSFSVTRNERPESSPIMVCSVSELAKIYPETLKEELVTRCTV